VIFELWDALRRRLAAREPFPEAWRVILRRRVPFYDRLDESTRDRFEHKLKVFVRTKEFQGARDFAVDDEVRVVIAATAARLVTNLADEHYERLSTIVVYASHYKHPDCEHVIFGEANDRGAVVLSWEAVLRGLDDPRDGHDTATHEFAHALDVEDGAFDGAPQLEGAAYAPWARVMTSAYDGLRRRKKRARPVLRDYAGKNPAEFFAVSTEAFFEKPRQMKEKHPALYEQLAAYYRCDPAG
jgi:Mlc titration factor MtfA (ptsG expression regulator)